METNNNAVKFMLVILRIAVGALMFYYGSLKVGLWKGGGFDAILQNIQGTVQSYEKFLHIPPYLGIFGVLGEFLGGLGLLFGFLTRIAAFGVSSTMFVATIINISKYEETLKAHPTDPFTTIGYPALICLVAFCYILVGTTPFSIDSLFSGRRSYE